MTESCSSLYEPERVTRLIGDAVPAFRSAGIRFEDVSAGACVGLLPLNEASTNQHGTHQATIVGLAGDYVGGLALASLFPEQHVMGIHPVHSPDSQLLWLASFELKFLKPSCSDLRVSTQVPAEIVDGVRSRFAAGEAQFVPLDLSFDDDAGEPVAKGRFVYFLRHSAFVAPRANKSAGTLFTHISKSSARLVASMRAREADRPAPLFDDPYSAAMAGPHGKLIGDRLLAVLPELQPMVAARTRHLDDCLRAAVAGGVGQIVLVGSGLDCRPARLTTQHPDLKWFELDLPHMLEERSRAIEKANLPHWRRYEVPFNLLVDDPAVALRQVEAFDAGAPAFVTYEGCSMYFAAADAARIFAGLAALVRAHSRSRMWFDFVSSRVAAGGPGVDGPIGQFLGEMARLGEPFVFGLDQPGALASGHGLSVECEVESGALAPNPSPIFSEYRFALLRPMNRRPGPRSTRVADRRTGLLHAPVCARPLRAPQARSC